MILKRLTAVLMLLFLLLTGMATAEETNLLKNPGFEALDSDGLPSDWFTDAYRTMAGYTIYSLGEHPHSGEHCVEIENIGQNDARFAQTVPVEPDSMNRLSGWVRADDIADSGHGANISIADVYVFSRSLYSTDGWEYVECYGITGPEQTELTVFVRVGGYSGESIGTASFDDISLTRVDELPAAVVPQLWYNVPAAAEPDPVYSSEISTQDPFWPQLLLLSACYLFVFLILVPHMVRPRNTLTDDSRGTVAMLLTGILSATLVRFIIAFLVPGYEVDVNCFVSWGNTMRQHGPTMFYQSTSFCDYPPAYLYVLGLNSVVGHWLEGFFGYAAHVASFKFIPMLADIAAALLMYHIAVKSGAHKRQAAMFAVLLAWNPVTILNSAAWCQMDSVLCLMLVIIVWLAICGKWQWVLPLYVLATLVKPQALMFGPLGLVAVVIEWIKKPEARKQMLIGVGGAVIVAAAILVPFSIHQPADWLIQLYSETLASYPYAVLNATNLFYLAGGNWSPVSSTANWLAPTVLSLLSLAYGVYLYKRQKRMRYGVIEPIVMVGFTAVFAGLAVAGASWTIVGTVAMTLSFVVVLSLYIRSQSIRTLPLLGGLLILLLYVLGVKMHERYLMPAVLFFSMAYALQRDKRILYLLVWFTSTMFINEGIVLDNSMRLGSAGGHLNADTYLLNNLLALANVLTVPYALKICYEICFGCAPIRQKKQPAEQQQRAVATPDDVLSFRTDHTLHWKRIDWILMLAVTAIYAVVALWNLGSTKAPQNPWSSSTYEEQVVIDLGQEYESFTMLYFAQVSYDDFTIAISKDGETWTHEIHAEMAQGQCFRWKYVTPWSWVWNESLGQNVRSYTATPLQFGGRYVRISPDQVGLILNEVIFRDQSGNRIEATILSSTGGNEHSPLYSDPAALLDEQDTLTGEPSWYNSTYFDEIYHARTAFEHLNNTPPYETTHPPLGKVMMSWFVGLFGMTPFGWRFAGALMGVLMLPVMYLLGKQLTKRTDMAFAAMTMMALDCMHLTQTRIATIDSFPVLFILCSYLFMLRFMQRDITQTPIGKLLPDLALSGVFMGLGIASKWIGVYAGVGLAVLFFWTCIRHIRLGWKAELLLASPEAAVLSDEQVYILRMRVQMRYRRPLVLCCWCVLLFAVVPVLIYLPAWE